MKEAKKQIFEIIYKELDPKVVEGHTQTQHLTGRNPLLGRLEEKTNKNV